MKSNSYRYYENYILLEICFTEKHFITKYVNTFNIRNGVLIIGFYEDNSFFEESIPMFIISGLHFEDYGEEYEKQ